MFSVSYRIGNILIEIQSDFLIETFSHFETFLAKGNADIVIKLIPVEKLKSFGNHLNLNTDKDRMADVYRDNEQYVLALKTGIHGEIYAHAIFRDDKTICVYYLKNEAERFKTSKLCIGSIGLENILSYYDMFVLHSSLINYKENGIAFMGPSGIGKSTRADLWVKYTNATIINGDRVIIKKEDNDWYGYGSPYAGSSPYHINEKVKLRAIIEIVRGDDFEKKLCHFQSINAVKALYKNTTLCLWNKNQVLKTMNVLENIVKDIPVYQMICPPDESCIKLLKEELGL